MATTQQLIAELTTEQRQSLFARLQSRSRDKFTVVRNPLEIPKLEPMGERRFEPFPLTDIQQAYWVGRQSAFNLGNIAAHGYMEVDCEALDLPRLEAAFNQLINRHDMLRAVVNPDGRQQILRTVSAYRFARLDLKELPEENRMSQLDAVRQEMSHQVLDTTVWPLFDIRASLLPEGLIRLHLSIDVLIFDALSFDIISEELRRLYQGDELAPLTFSYADYVHGLTLLKDTDAYRESLEYWRNKIKELPPGPDFQLAVAPETIDKPTFRRLSGHIDAARWGQIKFHAQRLGVTPSAVLLTAYGNVLARWSSRKRFTLNLTLFNRLPFHLEVNRLVGDFTSVILLELDYSRPASFAEQVKSVQEQLWSDMDHRYVSGVQVLRELAEQRRDANPMLIPVVFTSAIQPTMADDGGAMVWLGNVNYVITQTPQVWLDHQVTENAGQLEYDWDSVQGLFPLGFLEAMFDSYRQLIEGLGQDDTLWQRSQIDILPQEQRQLIAAVNATRAPVPTGLLHEPFIRQAFAEPDRIAVIDADTSLTYGELYRLSNALAQRLWLSGTGSAELVGILIPKGRWQVVATLGILEAGCAYLPIEPGYGDDRIAQIIQLSGLHRVVTDNESAALRLPAGIEVLQIRDMAASTQAIKSLPALQRPTDLAYVIYTSGSTGTPKGVMIDHRGALNTCVDINQRFAVGPDDRVLSLSALNFDLSVYDIFGLLAVGGALVLPHFDKLRDPKHWDEMIRSHDVTMWNTVPALMDIYTSYLDEVSKHKNDSLRIVMMSGDWIPLNLPDAIRNCCPQAKPISLGGATEASIWSIIFPIDDVDPAWRSIPYGKAMLNQSFHVLDEQLQDCPVWVQGELFIGGIGVAKGYWRDAERTAAQFINHPYSGEKLYRTGDLGRLLPCGNIEFLGRKDFQVKINGFRVELGEVEVTMSQFKGVKAAVCSVIGDSGRSRRLLAYYVRDPETAANANKNDSEKIRFRLSQPGLRRFNEQTETVALASDSELSAEYYRRRSQRLFPDTPVNLEQLGMLLSHLRRNADSPSPKYRYGSAGSLYPVQLYLYAVPGRIADLDGGMYYYDPDQHRLIRLSEKGLIDANYYGGWNAPMVKSAAFHLFLIGNLDAIEPLYHGDSMHLCQIESGLMTQVLEQEAYRFDLGLCQLGGFDFERARPLFCFEQRAVYLHALVGGVELSEAEQLELQLTQAQFDDSDEGFETHLREYLSKKLPDYMVPSVFVRLDELPLSANGKLDRKALPQPRKDTDRPVDAVVTNIGLARQICAVWQEVLDVDSVGPTDNFFDLGGTSVDMIKIHTRLQPLMDKEVPLVDMFFVYPTIAALVECLQPKQIDAPTVTHTDNSRSTRAARAPRRRNSGE